uniref:Reverse transcriptase domain-containing protein n=1 Tax=Podarcis muralis TaxID=64176 RepID=A0A670IGJ8_PODMU
MKCFEKLVRNCILSCLPVGPDPYQFAYKAKRSTEDAVAMALYADLTHLEKQGNYTRLLFVDFSSAFNTILPHRLVPKLLDLGLPPCLCRWILDFLSNHSQRVRLGSHVSADLITNTGMPQGCVLSPLLYTLYTADCAPKYPSNKIIKFTNDTTVVGLITAGEGEAAYRKEVEQLGEWCRKNNLLLNLKKTKEIIVDFRKCKLNIQPLIIEGKCVEQVSVFRFLGMELRDDLTWGENSKDLVKRAQQRLYFLRILRKNNLSKELLVAFYHCTVECILTYGLCVWFGSCMAREKTMLSRVVKTAERIIGCTLSTLDQIYAARCHKKAAEIAQDSTHPRNDLFQLLPSGRRYRVIKARTSCLRNSFYANAILVLNAA